MTRWRLMGCVLGVAALLGVAGCASKVHGVASADPRASAAAEVPIDIQKAFGEPSTVEPCSVVDVSTVQGVAGARRASPDALDDCPVLVTQNDGASAYVTVGPLEDTNNMTTAPLDTVTSLPNGLIVQVGQPDDSDYCDAYVIFPDGFDLHVSASPSDTDSHANVCASAVAMAENAGSQIDAGAVRHRRYPQGSVGTVDPCSLISVDKLATAGITDAARHAYPEGHECFWASDSDLSLPTAQLNFDVGERPTVLDPSTDSAATIAGRPSVISLYHEPDSDSVCWAVTGMNPYTDDGTSAAAGLVELAEVAVDAAQGSKVNACTAAKAVAAMIWPELPQPNH